MINNVNNFGKLFQNPDTYAQTYATQNNMSVDEAKEALKSQYGAPDVTSADTSIFKYDTEGTAGVNSISSIEDIQAEIDELLAKLNAYSDSETSTDNNSDSLPPANVDPDTYAQQYADENGLTLDEAKAELKAKYGDPSRQ